MNSRISLLNSIPVTYTNGNIGPNAGVATITIDELLATAGPVSLGVTGAFFAEDAGAVTLYIEFDASVFNFTRLHHNFDRIILKWQPYYRHDQCSLFELYRGKR